MKAYTLTGKIFLAFILAAMIATIALIALDTCK